ncbi:MAG: hypothetical protein IJP63_00960 [Acholeplasmatales bacterium]|nr:hypothetical protein [Acholeplasmatales bacterium]
MKKATRKIYLSIIFVTLSLLTMVATTFAWVGIVSNASFERFTINLETDNEKSDYGVMLSLTGKSNDFHDSIDTLELQKKILENMGVPSNLLSNEISIRNLFNRIKLSQCTTVKDYGALDYSYYLTPFKDLYGNKTRATVDGTATDYKGYFEFDVYISIYKIGEDADGSEKELSVYLRDGDTGFISGQKCTTYVANEIKFPGNENALSSQYLTSANNFEPGKKVQGNVTINSASAVRVAIQKAYSVPYGETGANGNSVYNGLQIYKYGGDLPSYDSKYGMYDFGGILPKDYNFARLLYNSTRTEDAHLGDVPSLALYNKRGDVTFVDDGVVNHIIDENDHVRTQDMIRLHVTFWFEGWDSDCFEAINDIPVSLSLNFSTKNPNEA